MKRFGSSVVCALVFYLGPTAPDAQWSLGSGRNPDGTRWCENGDERYEPGYLSPQYTSAVCNTLNRIVKMLGTSLAEAQSVLLARGGGDAPAPPASPTWTEQLFGDASGSVVEADGDDTIVHFDVASTNDAANPAVAYQSFASGDVEGLTTVPPTAEWGGYKETWSFVGVGLIDANNVWVGSLRPYTGTGVSLCKSGDLDTGVFDQTPSSATGLTGPFPFAVTYDTSAGVAKCFEDAGGGLTEFGSYDVTLTYPVKCAGIATSHSPTGFMQVTVTVTSCSGTITAYTPSDPGGGGSPTWSSIPNQQITEGDSVSFDCESYASDPDQDPLTFSEVGNVLSGYGLSIDSDCDITGTAANGPDTFNVTVRASDGTNTADETFQIDLLTPGSGDTFLIPTSQSNLNCNSQQPLQGGGTGLIGPGDTVILNGTSRGPIRIENCFGTPTSRITFRNNTSLSGPLVISGGSTWILEMRHVQYADLNGLGKWSGAPAGSCGVTVPGSDAEWTLGTTQCGIVVECSSGGGIQALVKFTRSSRHIRVRGLKVDGNASWVGGGNSCTAGQGFDPNDHNYPLDEHPGEWKEGFEITQNYVVDIHAQGCYWGPNYSTNGQVLGDLPLRNNDFTYNYFLRIGGEGCQIKSTIEGESLFAFNYMDTCGGRFTGDTSGGGGGHCVRVYEGGFWTIEKNQIENAAQQCIAHLSGFNMPTSYLAVAPITIRGNILRDCDGQGINSTNRSGMTRPQPTIDHNTIHLTGNSGILIASTAVTPCAANNNATVSENIDLGPCSGSGNTANADASDFVDMANGNYRPSGGSGLENQVTSNIPSGEDLFGNAWDNPANQGAVN